jgi:phosphonate transport system ATP-binding protein
LADGRIVFDGTAADITSDVLTQIYGEEDWSTTIRKVDEEDENGGETAKKNSLIRESSAG